MKSDGESLGAMLLSGYDWQPGMVIDMASESLTSSCSTNFRSTTPAGEKVAIREQAP